MINGSHPDTAVNIRLRKDEKKEATDVEPNIMKI